jgi:hypothetical protein
VLQVLAQIAQDERRKKEKKIDWRRIVHTYLIWWLHQSERDRRVNDRSFLDGRLGVWGAEGGEGINWIGMTRSNV